jgi:hypothetical protein
MKNLGANFNNIASNRFNAIITNVNCFSRQELKVKCLLLVLLSLVTNVIHAQYFIRTKQNVGMYFIGSPFNHYMDSKSKKSENFATIQTGLQHMFYPGISASLGYSYSRSLTSRHFEETIPFNEAHALHTGVLFDVRVAKFKTKYYRNWCHFLLLGLIGSIDYAYMLPNNSLSNRAFGEFSGTLGFSLMKYVSSSTKRNQSWTTHWDFFYRYGATPIATYDARGETIQLNRQEIGIRLRIYKHKVYDFLN